jgi:dihydroxy-acid dehydratase
VLHLLAMAREAGIDLTIGDFDAISRRTPLIADLKPGGSRAGNTRRSTSAKPAVSVSSPGAWSRADISMGAR